MILMACSLIIKLSEQGYSSETPQIPLDERRKRGAAIEESLKNEPDAAKAPLP
jgi:hypothetical protein